MVRLEFNSSDEWILGGNHSDDDDDQMGVFSQPIGGTIIDNHLDNVSDSSEAVTIHSLLELESIHGSDSSDGEDEVDSIHIQDRHGEVSFRLGQTFASIDDFYDLVKSYGTHNMYRLTFVKKDKKRCRVKCVNSCPWFIFCSKVGNLETYKVKTFVDIHNCQKEEVKENFADTKWLGNRVTEDFRERPNMTGEEVISLVAKKYNVSISIAKAYRIKAHALQLLNGNDVEQYSRLRDYCEELLKTSPGSTIELLTTKDARNGLPRFDRVYICLDASRKGFLAGCRPIIALDGCFLGGYYRGELLAAVALDGNNGLFIVAYAIVASETKDTWQWFLKKLLNDIGQTSIRGEKWVFISDQGKGLVAAQEKLYPSPYNRYCVRHMYDNFAKKWKDEQVRSLFWLAATSTTIIEFDKHMRKMKDKCYSAWEYVTRIGVERWSRAHFQDYVKCHVFSSSLVECFNSVMKKYRDNPVDILADNVRVKAMSLMRKKKEEMIRRKDSIICPEILNKLNTFITESTKWNATSCGDAIFEVTLRPQRFVVHLNNQTCTCRLWNLTGVPCVHACAAVKLSKGRPENFVNEYFTRNYFFRAYEYEINPMVGPDFWTKSGNELIQPPLLIRPPGRPKRKRRKSSLEGKDPHKAKRKYGVIKCGKCGEHGHNKRSCKEAEQV